MAISTLVHLRHSDPQSPVGDSDWALKQTDPECEDGGACALLHPFGYGKRTPLITSLVYGIAVFRWV